MPKKNPGYLRHLADRLRELNYPPLVRLDALTLASRSLQRGATVVVCTRLVTNPNDLNDRRMLHRMFEFNPKTNPIVTMPPNPVPPQTP